MATVPSPPTTPYLSDITFNSLNCSFADGANGGAAINSRQIGYGKNSSTPQTIIGSDGDTPIYPLDTGSTYYFWARTHNSVGYSNWSGRSQALIATIPDPPSTPWIYNIQPSSVTVGWNGNWDGGSAIVEYQLGYGTDPDNHTDSIWSWPPVLVDALTPGQVYYFWVRARNSVGWGNWSGAASNRTVAGARVKDGDIWRLAIPYVKDGGTWRLAQPWAKFEGEWKQTS